MLYIYNMLKHIYPMLTFSMLWILLVNNKYVYNLLYHNFNYYVNLNLTNNFYFKSILSIRNTNKNLYFAFFFLNVNESNNNNNLYYVVLIIATFIIFSLLIIIKDSSSIFFTIFKLFIFLLIFLLILSFYYIFIPLITTKYNNELISLAILRKNILIWILPIIISILIAIRIFYFSKYPKSHWVLVKDYSNIPLPTRPWLKWLKLIFISIISIIIINDVDYFKQQWFNHPFILIGSFLLILIMLIVVNNHTLNMIRLSKPYSNDHLPVGLDNFSRSLDYTIFKSISLYCLITIILYGNHYLSSSSLYGYYYIWTCIGICYVYMGYLLVFILTSWFYRFFKSKPDSSTKQP